MYLNCFFLFLVVVTDLDVVAEPTPWWDEELARERAAPKDSERISDKRRLSCGLVAEEPYRAWSGILGT